MRQALAEADLAAGRGEIPIGCVLVQGGTAIATGFNQREERRDATAHAEIVALQQAAGHFASWRLENVIAYVTLEPCVMCAGAFINARVSRVVYGCTDPKAGAIESLYTLAQDARLNHRYETTSGALASECAARLQTFFSNLRARSR